MKLFHLTNFKHDILTGSFHFCCLGTNYELIIISAKDSSYYPQVILIFVRCIFKGLTTTGLNNPYRLIDPSYRG